MNYYNLADNQDWFQRRTSIYSRGEMYSLMCCAFVEAQINETYALQEDTNNRAMRAVEALLIEALIDGATVMIWNVVPNVPDNREVEAVLLLLPQTALVSEITNRRTRNKVRTYFTYLTREW
jgi:hypothetical protein